MYKIIDLISQPFMQNAFLAAGLISICAASLGYFVIIRRYTFASHAISHIGFPGATGAVLIGVDPIFGLIVFCLTSAAVIGALGKKAANRDIITGTVLAFCTALGFYFSSLSSKASKTMQSVLFGSILGVSNEDLIVFAVFTLFIVITMLIVFTPLLFASVNPQVAAAKGVNTLLLNILFIICLSLTTIMSIQIVGSLLLFALLITPAASAIALTANPHRVILLSAVFALTSSLLGIVIGAALNLPISFAIVTISVIIYILCKLSKM